MTISVSGPPREPTHNRSLLLTSTLQRRPEPVQAEPPECLTLSSQQDWGDGEPVSIGVKRVPTKGFLQESSQVPRPHEALRPWSHLLPERHRH